MSILLPMFGNFQIAELKKFMQFGLTFGFIIGAYWSLGALKQVVVCSLLGPEYVPHARIFSMVAMIPLLMLYTKLLDIYTREKVFKYISYAYSIMLILSAYVLVHQPSCYMAYLFAWLCDSYGALCIALFWAIATDTTLPDSARRGFPLIVALGQIGGILLPLSITRLPLLFGHADLWILILLCIIPIIAAWYALDCSLRSTPSDLMVAFHGKQQQDTLEPKHTLFEGFSALRSHTYALAIALMCVLPDFFAVVFDMHYLLLAHQTYAGVELAQYLGMYGAAINGCTLVLLLCGISNITRYVAMSIALVILPIMLSAAVCSFAFFEHLPFLFGLMVYTKALNYALNVPLIKQLYIPTTHDTRFKVQAWIDGFGLQSSKVGGSCFNMLLQPLQRYFGPAIGRLYHVRMSAFLGTILIAMWIPIAYRLGRRYTDAIKHNRVEC